MNDTEVHSEPEDSQEEDISSPVSNDLEKHEYRNWVKGAKGLEYLQQGLAPFVDRVISAQHSIFKNKLPPQQPGQGACGCTLDNISIDHGTNLCKQRCLCKRKPKGRRICPNKFCSTLCQLLLQEHRFDNPSWHNSNISNWPIDHWTIAACFMSETACPSTSAQSTDASGLLSIIINANFFQQKVTSIIGQPNDVFKKARDKRNELLHKGEMELTDNELQDVIGAFIDVLQDQASLKHDQDAIKAVKKLEILKVDQIYISMAEEEEILNRRRDALNILKQLEQGREKIKTEIEEAGVDAVESVVDAKTNTLKELNECKETVIADIKAVQTSTRDEISELNERVTLTEMKIQSLQEMIFQSSKQKHIQSQDNDSDSSGDGESDNEEDETELKLKTDVNEIKDVDDKDITLRYYQNELAVEGLKGNNVVIMAPTNTGKTRVSCKIIQEHLRRRRKSGKLGRVIFLVEKEALVLQQGEVCANLLPAYRSKVISGRVQRDKKQYLRDMLTERDIFVVTAQVLLNSLKIGEISVRDFSMIVFDECHHTTQDHPFNEIMRFYLNLKLENSQAGLPQIIGLTASLGVGGSTSFKAGEQHMKTVMANLDAKCLCTVREHTAELRKFANIAKEHIKVATKRENDNFRKAVLDIMHEIDKYMRSHKSMKELPKEDNFMIELSKVPTSRGSESFQNWLSDLKDGLARMKSDQARKILFLCRNHLESYNKSLMLYADARAKDAVSFLSQFIEKEKKEFQTREKAYENQQDIELETDRFLFGLFEDQSFVKDEEENPKLRMMQDIVIRNLCRNENTRGIIFVKTRTLAKALENWMRETEALQSFNAKVCIGQGHADVKGQTKKFQRQILKYFKKGQHRVIITTSVAEEGLDITKCNLVIRYEHVTNEIVRLQSRGRARAKNSRYYVITEEDSWIVDKEKKNAMLEKLMDKIIPVLQKYLEDNPERWENEKLHEQKERKLKEELKEKRRAEKVSIAASRLHCQQCNAFICLSTDIRKIHQSHHVVIDESVRQRVKLTRKPISKYKDEILQTDGDTNCANDKCNFKLGGVCTYSGYEFPLIAIAKFRVVDTADEGRNIKKWKDANFEIIPFSVEELSQVVEERKEEGGKQVKEEGRDNATFE